jgi:hypothetical protein
MGDGAMSAASVAYRSGLTSDAVNDVLDYDPATGVFTWKVRASARRRIGSVAGGLHPDGYRIIKVHGISIRAHWLAWLVTHGEWPAKELDHINRNRDDNRIANLRTCSRAENAQNRASGVAPSKYGRGVYFARSRYFAKIRCGGRNIHLGHFPTAEEAANAYLEARRELHADFAPVETPA